MPSRSVAVDTRESPGVEEDIPIRHTDSFFVRLRAREGEFSQLAARAEIVLVLVCLSQAGPVSTVLAVGSPFGSGVVRRPAAVFAIERDMLLRSSAQRHWAEGLLAHSAGLFAHLGKGRL